MARSRAWAAWQQGAGQQGTGQQAPPWAGQFNPFVQNPQAQTPFLAGPSAIQQMLPALGQLAQQLTIQCVLAQQVAQQISTTVQHLAHQLAVQNPPGQYYGQNPLAIQGATRDSSPQMQAWGVARPQTIQ